MPSSDHRRPFSLKRALSSELLVLSDVVVEAPAVIFRAKDRPPQIRRQLAKVMREQTDCLILASMIDPAADGVHLAGFDRYPKVYQGLVGRSCHGLDEVRQAEIEGVDYVTLSPVFETESKPGYGPPLGLGGLGRIVRQAHVPIYALGGIDLGRVAACRDAGAAGVAVQGAVARSPDPQGTIAALLDEWHSG
ncbi:thiamine phosphate synthase [Candidatus Poriferisocius sp.]|uniref:thiamine phosphate synthase n=1 Tax=Candidatus Poriferisocius sp. TaxID=3101276 RepID=UPI003B017B0C